MPPLLDWQVVMLTLIAALFVFTLVVAAFEVKRERRADEQQPPPESRDDYLLNAGPCQCDRCTRRTA